MYSAKANAADFYFNYKSQAREAAEGSGFAFQCSNSHLHNGINYTTGFNIQGNCQGPDWWYGQCGEFTNLLNGTCYEINETPACPDVNGQVGIYNQPQGICEYDAPPVPLSCAIDEMTFRDEFGNITSCIASIDPDSDTCENVQGYINNTLLCADNLDQCNAAGGDFGYFNGEPMCVQPEIETAGDYCPSGYVIVYGAGIDGAAGSFNCVLPDDLPPTICDGSLYDCDGDKMIDDQNKNGCVDNGIADDPLCLNILQPQTGVNGQDPLNPPIEGAGDCDPTSRNYAKCAGFLGDEEEPEDARGTRVDLSSGASMDQVAGSIYTRLENAPIVQMIGNVSQVFSFTNEACPTPSFEAFGKTFSIDFHCQLYLDIAGILSALMMIVFSVAGIRHIASA
ncbi:MAG TPA: hypothetical protein EYQ00_06435 [Dehalococcoidia bacterium]|nr:hypothetical protein [Dehalococcoidia bacterium]